VELDPIELAKERDLLMDLMDEESYKEISEQNHTSFMEMLNRLNEIDDILASIPKAPFLHA